MKCPKCQMEINSNSKFCTKCGCNLAAEAAKASKPPEQAPQSKCVKCGAALMPGAKFCTKCGTPNDSPAVREDDNRTMFLYEDEGGQDDGRTMLITPTDIPQANAPRQASAQAPAKQTESMTMPIANNAVPPIQQEPMTMAMPIQDMAQPDGDGKKNKKNQNNKNQKQAGEKSGGGLIIAILILTLLIAASGAAGYLVLSGKISIPAFSGGASGEEEQATGESSEETTTEEATEEEGALSPELSQRLDETDALLTEGKDKVKLDSLEDIADGSGKIRDAINKFDEIAQEAGDTSLVEDKLADGYATFVTAVIKRKDIMVGQQVSGSVYSQVVNEMNDAEALAGELSEKGYAVDVSALTSARDEFKKSYTEKVVEKFDDFVNRETGVSRTELWDLMKGFDGMFDGDDGPIRLRYAYALSWWTQKQIEIELAGGTITEKGAAIKIAGLIEAMDYNPMMIDYYITYMKKSNEDCADVSAAYKEVIDKINSQGIKVGADIPLNKFWYYNDFGAYSSDEKNGVTPENRAWIRDRMKDVQFVK